MKVFWIAWLDKPRLSKLARNQFTDFLVRLQKFNRSTVLWSLSLLADLTVRDGVDRESVMSSKHLVIPHHLQNLKLPAYKYARYHNLAI